MSHTKKLTAVFIGALALAAVPSLVFAAHSSPGTVYVDDTCNPPADGSIGDPFCTIQEAVNHASNGDTILVQPGTYTESVTVGKSIRLLGAKAGKDATKRTNPVTEESVVNGNFVLEANTIQLDGFIIQGNATGPGIETRPAFSGYKIMNNIIKNHVFGLYLHSNGTTRTDVIRNFFDVNNQTGAANGNAIYSDQGLHKADITRNKSRQHDNSAFTLTVGSAAQPNNSHVTFSRNESIEDTNMINWYSTNNSEISRNTARGVNDPGDGAAIFLADDNHGITISRNEIRNRGWTGIVVTNLDAAGTPDTADPNNNITIERNILRQLDQNGIEIRDNGVVAGGAKVERNEVRTVLLDGILFGNLTSGNTISRNFMRGGGEHDAHDNSTGSSTAGTANTWTRNDCVTDQPDGLCRR